MILVSGVMRNVMMKKQCHSVSRYNNALGLTHEHSHTKCLSKKPINCGLHRGVRSLINAMKWK